MPNGNRRRGARSGWVRRRAATPADSADQAKVVNRSPRLQTPPLKSDRARYNLDADMRFTSVNVIAFELWRKAREWVIGKTLGEAFPAAIGSDAYQAHLRSLQSLRPFRGKIRSPVLDELIDLEIDPWAGGYASASWSRKLQ